MRGIITTSFAVGIAAALAGYAFAGPDRVTFPSDFAKRFVLYSTVDRPDRKIVRFMYVSPESHARAKANETIPNRSVLVMEDRKAKLDGSGNAEVGADGRLIATPEVTAVFVMEKRTGWGEAYAPAIRNGDWDYAWYLPSGTPRADAKFDGCFACHKNRASRDFNFTYTKYLMDRDGK